MWYQWFQMAPVLSFFENLSYVLLYMTTFKKDTMSTIGTTEELLFILAV